MIIESCREDRIAIHTNLWNKKGTQTIELFTCMIEFDCKLTSYFAIIIGIKH